MARLSAWGERLTLGSVGDSFFGPIPPQKPQIVQLRNGEILIAWTNLLTNGYEQQGQVVSSTGSVLVPTYTFRYGGALTNVVTNLTWTQKITELKNGGFVGVFEDQDEEIIFLQEFDSRGIAVSSGQTAARPAVGSIDDYELPDVASSDTTSSFVIFGEFVLGGSVSTGGAQYDLFGRTYNPATNAYGPVKKLINVPVETFSIHALSNGNYLVLAGQPIITFEFSPLIGVFVPIRNEAVVMSIIDRNGNFVVNPGIIASSQENSAISFDYKTVALSNGGFIISLPVRTGESGSYIFYNSLDIYNGAGDRVDGGRAPSGNVLALAALPAAEFVVLYRTGLELRAQHFSANGVSRGDLLIETLTSTRSISLEAVGLQDGRFAVTWQDASDLISFQIFDTRESFNGRSVHPVTGEQLGTIFDDSFTVGATTPLARGFAGDDIITQFRSTDVTQSALVMGDDGDDQIIMKNRLNNDTLDGGAGVDTIDWRGSTLAGATFDLQSSRVTDTTGLTQTMINFENLIGTASSDRIIGSEGDNFFDGQPGDDTILGGGGADEISGGMGNDRVFGEAGDDKLAGSVGNDLLQGGTGSDTIYGDPGQDTIDGGGGIDLLFFSGGTSGVTINLIWNMGFGGDAEGDRYSNLENVVTAGFNDAVIGNAGNNIIASGAGLDTVYAFNGDDQIFGEAGEDVLYGDHGNDSVNGGGGSDFVIGGEGNDVLAGGTGNERDYLYSNFGNDLLYGEGGDDIFDLRFDLKANDFDTLVDFEDFQNGAATNDYIALPEPFRNFAVIWQPTAAITQIAIPLEGGNYMINVTGTSVANIQDQIIWV